MKPKAKILFVDIETAPKEAYVWGLYNQNIGINQIKADQYMLCWAAKWAGERKVHFDSIVNHKSRFKKNPKDDGAIVKGIWNLMDEADIIVAHHGDSFDLKWLNTVFIKHNFPPVSPYKSVDTRKQAAKSFKFSSNKLDFLGRVLNLGQKVHHDGFDLWTRCMAGDRKSWKLMEKYNKADVTLLEKLYNKLLPFMKSHPNMALYTDKGDRTCSRCGGNRLKSKGRYKTNVAEYRRLVCLSCGSSSRENVNLKQGKKILRGV